MRRFLWIGVAGIGLPLEALSGQTAPVDRDAVVTALRHVRKDLPSEGKIALLVTKALSLPDAREVGAALGAELREPGELSTCAREDGFTACRFREVVGALSVSQVEQVAADRLKIRVWTHVQMTVSWRPPWLYGREYEVELARLGDRTWTVVGSAMVTET